MYKNVQHWKWTGHHMRLIAALICDALAAKVHYHVSYYGLNPKSDQTESSDAAESDACFEIKAMEFWKVCEYMRCNASRNPHMQFDWLNRETFWRSAMNKQITQPLVVAWPLSPNEPITSIALGAGGACVCIRIHARSGRPSRMTGNAIPFGKPLKWTQVGRRNHVIFRVVAYQGTFATAPMRDCRMSVRF